MDIANSTHILKTVIHGTKKDDEDPKYFCHNYYTPLQFMFQGSLQWKMGPWAWGTWAWRPRKRCILTLLEEKIFKTHLKYLQAKSIVANLTQCETELQAACSWTVDEYETTIEVGEVRIFVFLWAQVLFRPAWLIMKHLWTALKFVKAKNYWTAGHVKEKP